MISQSQLIELVRKNMHLFKNQYQPQQFNHFQNQYHEKHKTQNMRDQVKQQKIDNDLKLDLWKVNDNLDMRKRDQFIGPILSFQRRNIWQKNSPSSSKIKYSSFIQHPKQHQFIQHTKPQQFQKTISKKFQQSNTKNNKLSQLNNDQSQLYSTVNNDHQRIAQIKSKQNATFKQEQCHIKFIQSQYLDEQIRGNNFLNRTESMINRNQVSKRRKKIFSLPSHTQKNSNTLLYVPQNNRNKQLNKTTKIIHKKGDQNLFSNDKQNIRVNSFSKEPQTTKPSKQKILSKRNSLMSSDYLPSPSQLSTILKTIEKQSRYVPYVSKEYKNNIRQKKQRASIRYHESLQYQPINKFLIPQQNTITPLHPEIFNPQNFTNSFECSSHVNQINFNYVNTSFSNSLDTFKY